MNQPVQQTPMLSDESSSARCPRQRCGCRSIAAQAAGAVAPHSPRRPRVGPIGSVLGAARGRHLWHSDVSSRGAAVSRLCLLRPGTLRRNGSAQIEGLLARGYRPWPLRKVLACHRGDQRFRPRRSWSLSTMATRTCTAMLFRSCGNATFRRQFFWPRRTWTVRSLPFRRLAVCRCAGRARGGLETVDGLPVRGNVVQWTGRFRDAHARSCRFPRSPRGFSPRFGPLAGRACARGSAWGKRPLRFPSDTAVASTTDPNCPRWRKKPACSALSTDSDLVRPGDDPFNWGRFTASGTDSAASLAAKLGGWYSLAAQHLALVAAAADGPLSSARGPNRYESLPTP